MLNNSLSELHKRQALIEEVVHDVHASQIKELYEELQTLKEKIAKLENEKQVQIAQPKEA